MPTPVDTGLAAGSSLSIGYFSPCWTSTPPPNGIVTYVGTVVQALEAMGHRVTILALGEAEETPGRTVYDIEQARAAQTKLSRVVDGLLYRIAPESTQRHMARRFVSSMVRRAVAEAGIQILEIEETFGTARWVCQAAAIPVCVRLHGPWFLNGTALGVPENAAFHRRIRDEGRAIQTAAAITAPSRDILEQTQRFYGIDLPAAEAIPNPTSPVPAADRWRPQDCESNQVLFVGRFDRHKGGDLIIEAFKLVVREIPDARLRFVGPDRGCVASDGQTWHIEDFIRDRIPGALDTGRVEWLGQQPPAVLAGLRRSGAVTVICSRYENFPYTVLESMATGCPTVAADVGGIPELVQDGVHGLLHRPGDPADIAAKIIELLKDPVRAAELGRQAALTCEQRFYPEVVVRRLIDFYRRVLDR
jgi:glycosyltransferase involved in cell wall biosynthesis